MVGISPVPAKLETDWMTGKDVGCDPVWTPFHCGAMLGGAGKMGTGLLWWKLKQLTELKNSEDGFLFVL